MTTFFPRFARHRISTAGAEINAVVGGSGPPLLLLHGYPQTHVAWHRLGPMLARDFTVVATDLRGYGDSTAPADGPWTKRAVAADQVAVMAALGHGRFGLVGHDRGGRVAHRLALDHRQAVAALVSLTVIPTPEMWDRMTAASALNAWHWFMLAQPGDLPERLLAADPALFLDRTLARMVHDPASLDPAAVAEYHRCFADPAVRRAMIGDYRAAAGIDDATDRADLAAGRRVACPVHVLWEEGRYARGETPVDIWQRWATAPVSGGPIRSGHLMPEEAPAAVAAAIIPFLKDKV